MVLGAEPGAVSQVVVPLLVSHRPHGAQQEAGKQEGLPARSRRPRRGGRLSHAMEFVLKCYLL